MVPRAFVIARTHMWQEIFASVVDFVRSKWLEVLGSMAFGVMCWYFGRRAARRRWESRDFLHRLNVSLNILQPGQPLQIRTLMEKGVEEIFLNTLAAERVAAAARRTKPDNPLLPLPEKDYWFYLNAVLNEVSERFALGEIRRDLGLPVTMGTYLLCLTCECAGELRTRKIRAMVIQKHVLENLPEKQPALERSHHTTRWSTLQILAKEFRMRPYQFIEVQVAV